MRHLHSIPVAFLICVVSFAALATAPVATADTGSAADETPADTVLERALVLGPIPPGPVAEDGPFPRGDRQLIPEIDPGWWLPEADAAVAVAPGITRKWRHADTNDGEFVFDEPGVYWLAARLQTDHWSELTVSVTAGGVAALYFDGALEGEKDADGEDALQATLHPGRGSYTVFVRVVESDDESAGDARDDAATGDDAVTDDDKAEAGGEPITGVRISAEAVATAEDATTDDKSATAAAPRLAWHLDPQRAPTNFDWSRQVASISGLAIAPEGKLIARRLSRRNPIGEGSRATVAVLDQQGRLVADDLGSGSTTPLQFTPDGKQLLLRRSGESGTDLLLWTAPAGPVRTVVRDEPGLGLVRFSADGKFLLLASTRGQADDDTATDADDAAPRHWEHLRERVSDYSVGPHLHLVDVATGTRRELSCAGDYVLDDAVFLPGDRAIVYGITRPQAERPWFHTEIRTLDLRDGSDRLVADFVGGWEVRPQRFAPSPDGKQLAFLGPPEQVGGGRTEHNVYNKQVWLLDLDTGSYERISNDLPYAFEGGGGLPLWDPREPKILLRANEGSRNRLAWLYLTRGNGWQVRPLETADETVGAYAVSPDAGAVVYTSSGPATPASLSWFDVRRGRDFRLDNPNEALTDHWRLVEPTDASFTGPGGETIEAWFYRPAGASEAKIPLLVYYYGGCTPVIRGFSTTHQFFVANGYAMLVINPRGATGYGDAFADHHAGDWGPKASADIIRGTEALLAAESQLDAQRVGIYGGSYGGFMTEYLVSATDLFAAAVSMYGISDLATYWGQGTWGWTYGDMALGGANPWHDWQLLVKNSPLFRADRINTPLLLLHGQADSNVTPGQSVELFTALSTQNKPVEMVLFPGQGHGIAGTWESWLGHRTMMLEWFDRFLKDQPGAWEFRWE